MKDDTVLVAAASRTGQTWLCMLLSYLLNARFLEPYCLLRGISWDGRKEIVELTSGQLTDQAINNFKFVVKTHETPDPFYSLTKSLIILVRDPRDSIVSQYLRRKVTSEQKTDVEKEGREIAFQVASKIRLGFKDSLHNHLYSNKIMSVLYGALKWKWFYESWIQFRFAKLIRFEDLKKEPHKTMHTLLDYLSIAIKEERISEALEEFSIRKRSKNTTPEEQEKSLTFRKGIVGDHKQHFNFIHLLIIRCICGKTARKFGYEI